MSKYYIWKGQPLTAAEMDKVTETKGSYMPPRSRTLSRQISQKAKAWNKKMEAAKKKDTKKTKKKGLNKKYGMMDFGINLYD